MHLRAGLEPEMIWLKADEDGKPDVRGHVEALLLPHRPVQPVPADHPQGDRVRERDGPGHDPGRHEDAPGQLELNFNFDVAEKTADNLSTYRQVCKQVGREMQAFPCFMPKPFMGVSANGCHHNISLWEGDDNKFMPAPDEDQRSPARSASGRSAGSSSTSARSRRSVRRRSTRTAACGTRASGRRCSRTGASRTAPPRCASRRRAVSSTARSTRPSTRTSRSPR